MTTNPNEKPINNGPISHDYSKASTSGITSTDEDSAKIKALSEVLGINQQREEIDQINTSLKYLAEKMGEMAKVIDAQSKALNNLNPAVQQAPNQSSKLEEMANLAEKFSPLIDKFFPQNTAVPLIDNQVIQDKMKQSFFDNLDTGEAITKFIKESLKKRVTKDIINTSLKDIGTTSVEHGPA